MNRLETTSRLTRLSPVQRTKLSSYQPGESMKTQIQSLLTALCALALAPAVHADEKKVARKDVPKAVLAAAAAKAPKGRLVGFSVETLGGKTVYEVKIEVKAREGKQVSELMLSPEGTLVGEERKITLAALPEPVKKALAEGAYAKAKVLGVEEVIDHAQGGAKSYELEVMHQGKKHELLFSAEGALQKDEQAAKY